MRSHSSQHTFDDLIWKFKALLNGGMDTRGWCGSVPTPRSAHHLCCVPCQSRRQHLSDEVSDCGWWLAALRWKRARLWRVFLLADQGGYWCGRTLPTNPRRDEYSTTHVIEASGVIYPLSSSDSSAWMSEYSRSPAGTPRPGWLWRCRRCQSPATPSPSARWCPSSPPSSATAS